MLNIKKEREKRGMSQKQFAELLGVVRKTIVNYEAGGNIPEAKAKVFMKILSKNTQSENKLADLMDFNSKEAGIKYLTNKIENETLEVLELIDKEKILGYIYLKEKEFLKLESFKSFIEKQKASARLRKIAKNSD